MEIYLCDLSTFNRSLLETTHKPCASIWERDEGYLMGEVAHINSCVLGIVLWSFLIGGLLSAFCWGQVLNVQVKLIILGYITENITKRMRMTIYTPNPDSCTPDVPAVSSTTLFESELGFSSPLFAPFVAQLQRIWRLPSHLPVIKSQIFSNRTLWWRDQCVCLFHVWLLYPCTHRYQNRYILSSSMP